MKKIIFVCTGNTCRSPMAEGIAREELAKGGSEGHHVSSAGTSAVDGYPASQAAVQVSREDGVDISSHRTRLLTKEMVDEADLIVVMTEDHLPTIGAINPAAMRYSWLLSDFLEGVHGNIPDPIGQGMQEYYKVYHLIKKYIQAMVSKLDTFDGWKAGPSDDSGA